RQCVQPGRGVDAGDPQPPEFPLLAAAVAIGVLRRPLDRLLRGLPQLAAPAEVALGELHHLVLALQARDVAFDARHGPAPYPVSLTRFRSARFDFCFGIGISLSDIQTSDMRPQRLTSDL